MIKHEETLESPINIKRTEKQIEVDTMREALTSIATEMQRFHESSIQPENSGPSKSTSLVSKYCNEKEKVFTDMLKYKTKIRSKRDRIHKLSKNLKTACFVAKTIAAAKEDESTSLKQYLDYAQSECLDLLDKSKSSIQIINSLSRENQILHNKLDNVAKFIRLGYRELQKIRHESLEEPSVLVQLKQLIVCCGEYYANYCNERDLCLQLDQRNTFLKNKIQFLENNVGTLSEELRALKYQTSKLKKENEIIRDRCTKSKPFNSVVEVKCAEVKTKPKVKENGTDGVNEKRESSNSQFKLESAHALDLSPHLEIVTKLLNDQDTLLRDLKILSREFNNNSEDDDEFYFNID